MKFRAHETFFIRKGWLNKGLSQVYRNGDVFISKEVNPMDVFGVGSNMVKSLRYWMQAVGLTQEPAKGRRTQTLTTLGESVYAHDRYIEEIGTLMLLQYRLATNKDDATFSTITVGDSSDRNEIKINQTTCRYNKVVILPPSS